jgi:uncharacterized repeat protein (TIGR03803 family)
MTFTTSLGMMNKALRQLLFVLAFASTVTVCGWAATENILVKFTGDNGAHPYGTLVFDQSGNLYGTTSSGGPNGGLGTVYELSPVEGGGWTQTTLYTFNPTLNPTDGSGPYAGVILDAAGNLYGTTLLGGGTAGCQSGCGVVFQLTPVSPGVWTENVLYRFQGGSDGASPRAGLVMDAQGVLYGTTTEGGGSANCVLGCGTVFKLAQTQSGVWEETILHTFVGLPKPDGADPSSTLVFDSAGNLWGTTSVGGRKRCATGCGTIFELTPNSDGSWEYKIVHAFGTQVEGEGFGVGPAGGVVVDGAGNIFGTTAGGTNIEHGTAFEFSPDGQGGWTGKLLHKFHTGTGSCSAPLILDAAGNLYGTAVIATRGGTAFEITPSSQLLVLKQFMGTDGGSPSSGMVFDFQGNLYGVTSYGGGTGTNDGLVYELTP